MRTITLAKLAEYGFAEDHNLQVQVHFGSGESLPELAQELVNERVGRPAVWGRGGLGEVLAVACPCRIPDLLPGLERAHRGFRSAQSPRGALRHEARDRHCDRYHRPLPRTRRKVRRHDCDRLARPPGSRENGHYPQAKVPALRPRPFWLASQPLINAFFTASGPPLARADAARILRRSTPSGKETSPRLLPDGVSLK